MKIPLLIWGESAENEIGGPIEAQDANVLDRRWLEECGGLLGLRTNDISDILQIPKEKLTMYTYPSDEELKKNGIYHKQHTNRIVLLNFNFKLLGSRIYGPACKELYFKAHCLKLKEVFSLARGII